MKDGGALNGQFQVINKRALVAESVDWKGAEDGCCNTWGTEVTWKRNIFDLREAPECGIMPRTGLDKGRTFRKPLLLVISGAFWIIGVPDSKSGRLWMEYLYRHERVSVPWHNPTERWECSRMHGRRVILSYLQLKSAFARRKHGVAVYTIYLETTDLWNCCLV